MAKISFYDELNKEFLKGKASKDLDGFYDGELTLIIPETILGSLGALLLEFWLPWKGKYFYKKKKKGDNILPFLAKLLVMLNGKRKYVGKKDTHGYHAFPFQTKLTRGLVDRRKKVLRLDYNLYKNPPIVRNVIDEVVMVGKKSYLGKAHIKDGNNIRTVAFFRLRKI